MSSSRELWSRHSVSLLSVWLKSCPLPTFPNEREEPSGLLRKCGSGTGAQDSLYHCFVVIILLVVALFYLFGGHGGRMYFAQPLV